MKFEETNITTLTNANDEVMERNVSQFIQKVKRYAYSIRLMSKYVKELSEYSSFYNKYVLSEYIGEVHGEDEEPKTFRGDFGSTFCKVRLRL